MRIIENLGKEVNFPKEVLREAYAAKMIEDEKLWLKMLEDRNKTSHTYDEELAYKIYCNIKLYHPVMQSTYNTLCEKFLKE
ncbi:nucleotidyltransferase substrate binding protein [endosymbiont of Acanthamoeba sp. UWC8]|nr:nucleotidyltransferase substrate binding protein [endosymbiont of Acanthamoeba sp. UWC8]